MDLCDGTLDSMLLDRKVRQSHLSAFEIFTIAIQVLEGLKYCHSRGYTHRDLNPRNVLLSKKLCECDSHPTLDHRYLLTDFGFSKTFEGQQYSSGRCGSDGYRAPELCDSKTRAFSDKTDIWAFACLLMELASTKTRKAFEFDWAATKYAEGSPDYPLPQLRWVSDNPVLTMVQLEWINEVLRLCFYRRPEIRPSATQLCDYFTGLVRRGECHSEAQMFNVY